MRSLLFSIIAFLFMITSLTAQSTKFRFEIDGGEFISIKKNAGGFNTIHQTNLQSSMFFGFDSGKNTIVDPAVFNSGSSNTAYGFQTLSENTSGFQNTAIGFGAMTDNLTGTSNVGIGFSALNKGISGTSNIGIGKSALRSNLHGDFNVAIGSDAMNTTNTAERSIAIGSTAAVNDSSSVDNVYVGFGAGRGTVFATDGFDRKENVMIGSYAGYYNQTNGNVFLGHQAGINSKSANQLYITNDDTDSLNTLIYGQFDNELVRLNAEVNIDGLYTLPTTAPLDNQYIRNSGGTLVWTDIDAPWEFGAGDDVVYEDGDVGVGIGNPIYKLDVSESGSTSYIARFKNTSAGASSRGLIVQTGPNSNPSSSVYYSLFLDGNGTNIGGIRGDGSGGTMYSTTSDRRLKQNIRSFESGLELIEQMNPSIYERKSKPGHDEIGFIAQDLQTVLPLVVGGSPSDDIEDSPMTVDYGRITPVLVAAIQEQQELIQALTQRLDDQDKQFNELRAEISKMKGMAQK
ncbi:MAG: tail fiber domain-containing protein [Saprospiraceae bacterium]|nr:tail fiber domain-containing protein [Saprospiraceae bacterium]